MTRLSCFSRFLFTTLVSIPLTSFTTLSIIQFSSSVSPAIRRIKFPFLETNCLRVQLLLARSKAGTNRTGMFYQSHGNFLTGELQCPVSSVIQHRTGVDLRDTVFRITALNFPRHRVVWSCLPTFHRKSSANCSTLSHADKAELSKPFSFLLFFSSSFY